MDSEIRNWFIKMIGSWIFMIQIMIIMYLPKISDISLLSPEIMTPVLLLLSFPIIFVFGFQTLKLGIKGLYKFYFNMDSLIALGTLIAFSTGIISFFIPIQDFSGISGMIMTIFLTGKFIESKARGRATSEIKKLLELGAKKARVLRKNKEIMIDISEIKKGDVMVVKPGEKIPTDGIIVKGKSSIDESMVTGESIPINKKTKDLVIGATINQDSLLHVKATKIGSETFLSHIIELVEEAQTSEIPIQELADKVTKVFVPLILIISALTFLGWIFLSNNLSLSIENAISVLVIACPCALGLAVPIALTVGSGIGAKNGILIRKGEAIQTMKQVKTIVFDKTGTITKGSPEVVEFKGDKKLFEIAASMEKLSEHPIAKAVVKKANLKSYKTVKNFKNFQGRGIKGKISNKEIIIGNDRFIKENKISLGKYQQTIKDYEKKAYTTLIVSENKKIIGVISVADSLKEDSVNAISILNNQGYETIMLTGDNETTAKAIAKKVGIKRVIANILPEDKLNEIKKLQEKNFVAFVGDGINDALALKQANVGIAIGTGTDIAIEAGDIVLAKGSLTGVVQSINLSKATFTKIKQNLFWAFFYNVIAIPLAIAGFLNPVIAEIAMAFSSITVVTNANLLRNKKI